MARVGRSQPIPIGYIAPFARIFTYSAPIGSFGFAANFGSLSFGITINGPAPSALGFSGRSGTQGTSAPSNLALSVNSAGVFATSAMSAEVTLDYGSVVSVAGVSATPGQLTTTSATLNLATPASPVGLTAQFGTLNLNVTGMTNYSESAADVALTASFGTMSLASTLTLGSFGFAARAGRLRIGQGRDIDFTYGFADEDQWSFGRADA